MLEKDFKEFISNKDKIIVKPINSCGGKGIEVISLDKDKLKNEYNILKIYNIKMLVFVEKDDIIHVN